MREKQIEGKVMAACIRHGTKIYPVCSKDGYAYKLEIDTNGYVYRLSTEYKAKPRFKKDLIWHEELYKIYNILNYLNMNEAKAQILKEAAEIICDRESSKAQIYGDFHDSMRSAAKIASEITGKNFTVRDLYAALVGLKLSRLKNGQHYDSYLDLIAYLASMSTLTDLDK